MGCQRCLRFGAPKRLDHSLIWTRGVSRRLVIGVRESYTCLADAESALGISRTHCKPTWTGIRLCGKKFSQLGLQYMSQDIYLQLLVTEVPCRARKEPPDTRLSH